MARRIGIDYGDRWFGLAMSDPTETIARPLEVVRGEEELWRRLEQLRREEDIAGFVLGLPLNMDGSVGPKARQVLVFKERLAERTGLPVEVWDERLTTVQAERSLREAGASRSRRRRDVDRVAAQILLQSFLDRQSRSGGDPAGLADGPCPGPRL